MQTFGLCAFYSICTLHSTEKLIRIQRVMTVVKCLDMRARLREPRSQLPAINLLFSEGMHIMCVVLLTWHQRHSTVFDGINFIITLQFITELCAVYCAVWS